MSVATSGTHDTEPLVVWWETRRDDERRKVDAICRTIQRLADGSGDLVDAPYEPSVRDVLLETLFASGSNLLLLPMQDVFGWRDRINEPATVTRRQLDVSPAVADATASTRSPKRASAETAARLVWTDTDGAI